MKNAKLAMALVLGLFSMAMANEAGLKIMTASEQAVYYAGRDGKSRIQMRLIPKSGPERERNFVMLRINSGTEGQQKYYVYFNTPNDVRGLSYLVFKHVEKNDERWLYIPAIHLIKQIAASDSKSSFVGSDFSYEDVSGRSLNSDTHEFLRAEAIGDRACLLVKNTPKDPDNAGYAYKLTWVDEQNNLVLKDEFYNERDEPIKRFTVQKVEVIDGIPTATERTMENLKSGHKTMVSFSNVGYNLGLSEQVFSKRSLKKPPRKWLK